MRITSRWKSQLGSPTARKAMLFTVLPIASILRKPEGHIALHPSSFRFSTHTDVAIDDMFGNAIPFWPVITEWPEVNFKYAPQDHRAEIPQVTIQLNADAIPADILDKLQSAQTLYGRLDLWTGGVPIWDAIPLIQGLVRRPIVGRRGSGIALTLTDGAVPESRQIPPGKMTREHFPLAPDNVADVRDRQVIISAFPYPILCAQVDADGREFYVCDPPLTVLPTKVLAGATELTEAEQPRFDVRPSSGAVPFNYTVAVFPDTLANLGLSGDISVSGGTGLNPYAKSSLEFLIEDLGGIPLAAESKAFLKTLEREDFRLSILLNMQGSVLEIATERLIPQIPAAWTFRNGELLIMPLAGIRGRIHVDASTDFFFPLRSDGPTETSDDSVMNAIEVKFTRDPLASLGTGLNMRQSVLIDANSAEIDPNLRQLLARSEAKYGRRYSAVDAADIIHRNDAIRLGSDLAKLSAMTHRLEFYQADWLTGMQLRLSSGLFLTDAGRGWTDERVVVVGQRIAPTGPIITVQTEDLGSVDSILL